MSILNDARMRKMNEVKAGRTRRSGSSDASGDSIIQQYGDRSEINAYDKKDLMSQIGRLAHANQDNNIFSQDEEMQGIWREAAADKNSPQFEVVGEVMAEEIWETLNREGFTRKLFAIQNVPEGTDARVKVRRKDVVAFQVTDGGTRVKPQRIYQPYVYPDSFFLTAHIQIGDEEIANAGAEILDEKYQDGLEAIMVREDRITRDLMNDAAGLFNDQIFFNDFTPLTFTTMRTQINRWGGACQAALLAFDLWDDIIADPDFTAWWDPVSKHELIMQGQVGSILDVSLITDGFRYDTLRVLEAGEVYFLGAPSTLGVVSQRTTLGAEAVNGYNARENWRGWHMAQLQAQTLINGRAVARGTRT